MELSNIYNEFRNLDFVSSLYSFTKGISDISNTHMHMEGI